MQSEPVQSNEEPKLRKKPDLIYLGRQILTGDAKGSSDPEAVLTLDVLIEEYLVKIGYSNAHVLGIIMNLLTVGKVRVEFRSHIDRVRLLHPEDILSPGEAGELFDLYLKEKQMKEKAQGSLDLTGKIVIQSRK